MVSVSKCLVFIWMEDGVANNVYYAVAFHLNAFHTCRSICIENHRNESWLNGPNNNFNVLCTHFRYRAASPTYRFAFQDRQQNVHIFENWLRIRAKRMNERDYPVRIALNSSFSALNNIYNNQNYTSVVEIVFSFPVFIVLYAFTLTPYRFASPFYFIIEKLEWTWAWTCIALQMFMDYYRNAASD